MSTAVDFIEYVCAQIEGIGVVRYKKMFGEYMVYINDKPLLLVCDSTVYVKLLPCLDHLMDSAEKGIPYTGAKEHYVLDIDDKDLTHSVILALEPIIPVPKPRKKKKNSGEITVTNEKLYEFEAEIKKVQGKDGAYIEIPFDIKTEFSKGRIKVHATFDCEPYDGSIVNMGVKNLDGSICYIIGIRKDIRAKIGKQAGDTIKVTIRERQ